MIPPLEKSVRVAGHVTAANGDVVFSRTDFHLPGPIKFSWKRVYRQTDTHDCGLGPGWRHSLSEVLELPENSQQPTLLLHTAEGRRVQFNLPPIGNGSYNRHEKLLLVRQSLHSFRLCAFDTPDKVFRADGNSGLARLNEIRDFYGNTLTIDYRDGLPQKIVTSWGRTLQFHYGDSSGNDSPLLQCVTHSPSPEETQALCCYSFAAEDSSPKKLTATEVDGSQECYEYSDGRLYAIQHSDGNLWQLDYDRQQRCHYIRHNSRIHQLRWQQARQRCTQTVADEHPTSWQFDARHNLLRQQQAGRELRFLYDHYNNLCARIDADGQRDLYRYDELGRLTRHTRNGIHHRFVYDALGRLRGAQRFGDSTWRFEYVDHPQPVSIIDPRGNRWICEYDERGQLRLLTDPEGGQVSLQWDAQAQLQEIHWGDRNWQFSYDHFQRLQRYRDDRGREESWQYDRAGRLQHARFAEGDYSLDRDDRQRPCRINLDGEPQVQWQHDEFARIRTVTLPHMPRWQLNYDENGRVSTLCLGDHQCEWQYDQLSQPRLFTDSNGREVEWQYDYRGRVTEYRDCDNHWFLHYSANGQLEKIRNNSGQQSEFHFDHHGRLTQAANQHSSLRYRYDEAGLLVAEHHDIRAGDNLSISHQYDARGWLKNSGSDRLNIACLFSPDASLFGVDANGEAVLRCEQRDDQRTWNLGGLNLQQFFDQGQLATISWGDSAASSLSMPVSSSPNLLSTAQLKSLHPIHLAAGVYRDRRGNIEREVRNNDRDRTQVPVSHSSHDHHTYHYLFDGWGLLSSVECGDFKTYFRYDPFGRRLWKISTHRRSARQRKVLTHWWSQGLWSMTTVLDTQESRTHYLHHPQELLPLARLRNDIPEYFISDGNGAIQGLADADGVVFWQATDGGNPCPDEYRGSAQIADSETRLYYRNFRYWHPGLRTYLDVANTATAVQLSTNGNVPICSAPRCSGPDAADPSATALACGPE